MNLTFLMKEYLNESVEDEIQKTLFGKLKNEFPVEVSKKPSWSTLENPPRLKRVFELKNSKKVIQFVYEILQYEDASSHSGSILIESNKVSIEVYTHSVDDITELDIEYAKEVGKIYKDVKDYE